MRTVRRSFDHKLHSNSRWRAVCTVFNGQFQYGEIVFFILYRYERKLPWFVKNWVRRKLGHRVRECLWKMVGMYSFVWEAFSDFTYVGGSKIFRTDAVKTIKLTIRPIGRRHPLSSSLPHVDTGPTVSSIFGTHPGSSFL